MLTKATDSFEEFEAALRRAWEIQNIRAELAGRQVRTANCLQELTNADRPDTSADENNKPSSASVVPEPQREP